MFNKIFGEKTMTKEKKEKESIKDQDEKKKDDEKPKEKSKEKVKKLTAEQLLIKKCKEYEDMLKRLQAEFENFKKRCEKDSSDAIKCASFGVVDKLLPLVDSFEGAIASGEGDQSGLELLYKQLVGILAAEGLREIESLNHKFDPFKHDVLLKDHNEELEDDIITLVIQKGYMLNDKVIRHAKVKINSLEKKE
jgi:molecular chaperone GrpE